MANWCQNIYGHKNTFFNPVIQNKGHVKAIKSHLIEFEDIPFIPVVVFISDCTLKISTKYPVVYASQLLQVILKFSDKQVIGNNRLNAIKEKLLSDNITDKEIRKQHVESVKSKKGPSQQYTPKDKCPCCGGNLVTRQGKYGAFLGCENYPKCKYIKNV